MNRSYVRFLLFNARFSEAERAIKYKIVFLNSVFLLAGIVAFSLAFIRIRTNLTLGIIDFTYSLLNFSLLAYLNQHREKIEIVSLIALTLSFLLFFSIYLLAPENTSRISLFFLLSPSAFFLKGRRAGRTWLAFIILSLLAGHFVPALPTSYSHFDLLTACIYLIALFFIFENYETFKENQYQLEQEQEVLRSSAEQIRKSNEELELKVQQRTQQLLEAQEELVRNEKLAVVGQVAGSVGHGLRNPLGVMSNAVYFLVLPNADETTREYLEIIKSEIACAERIVRPARLGAHQGAPPPKMAGVRELVELTLRKCDVPPAIIVKLDIPEEIPSIRVDPPQIHQVLRNLISNAVDAMPDGGLK